MKIYRFEEARWIWLLFEKRSQIFENLGNEMTYSFSE
jgi:hypothetical protein